MRRSFTRRAGLFMLAVAALLSACATGYRMDNTVQSFSGLSGLPANPSYRFERLPSQRALPGQDLVEALADPALHQVGLRRDDAQPRYAVQVGARVQRMLSPWADPWYGGGWMPGLSFGASGFGSRSGIGLGLGWGGPLWPRSEQPWYQREVSVLVRELSTNQVVYETRATNQGPWIDDKTALAAMFQAALQGFPTPPAGVRRVDLQVGGKK
jgi:hypothetical protein